MTLSTQDVHDTLNRLFRTDEDCWLSLHVADPFGGGLNTGELADANYTRQRVGWSAPANRTIANTNDVTFQSLPLATIGWLGVCNAGVGGRVLASLVADPAFITNAANRSIYIPKGTLAIELF